MSSVSSSSSSPYVVHLEYPHSVSTNPPITVQIHPSSSSLASSLASYIHTLQSQAISSHGYFSVAFSGGSLPKIVGEGLTSSEWKDKIEFSKWKIFYADERLVSLSDKDSNHSEVQKHFLAKLPASQAPQVFPLNDSLISSPAAAASDYSSTLTTQLSSSPPVFDLILLGMGPDGHTCSLFPGHSLLSEKGKYVVEIVDSPKPPAERITLTYPVLNAAKNVVFVVTGDKSEAVSRVLEGDEKEEDKLPSARVQAAKMEWFMDRDAASKLKKCKL